MESGSLLQEALEAMARKRQQALDPNSDSGDEQADTEEFLDVRIYPLLTPSASLDEVSTACIKINNYVKTWAKDSSYIWHAGGDGLVFGVSLVGRNDDSSPSTASKRATGTSSQNHQYNHKHDNESSPHFEYNNVHKKDENKSPMLCMRAIVRYGVCADDIWYTIALLLSLSKQPEYRNYAISVADGIDRHQILLIEAADYLPKWAADAGPDGCGNRVWIVRGAVRLIAPRFAHPLLRHYESDIEKSNRECEDNHQKCKSLKLDEAFDFLMKAMDDELVWNNAAPSSNFRRMSATSTEEYAQILVETHSAVQDSIKRRISRLDESLLNGRFSNMSCSERYHRAACVLPTSLAVAILKRPDLVPCAIQSFFKSTQALEFSTKQHMADQDTIQCLGNIISFDNLVIVIIRFTKIGYAMLKSCVEDFQLPHTYTSSADFNHMRTICEGSQHLKCALDVGVRLTCGFEWLVASERKHGTRYIDGEHDDNGMQRRLHELIRIRNAVCQTNNAFPLMKGDERQKISEEVNACAACPTFDEVRANICAFSYPFQSFEQQIKSTEKENSVDVSSFAVPSAEAVDDDDWMNVTDQQFESLMAEAIGQNNFNPDDFIESSMRPDAEEVKQVESMLKSFEFFLGQSSGFEGVDSSAERGKKPSKPTMPRKGNQTTSENEKNNGLDDVNIDPDKFLNILNGTFHDLRGDDGFFSDEEDEESSDDNLSAGEIRKEFFEPVGSDDIGVSEIMDLMDKELKGTKVEHNGESYIDYNRNEEDGSNDHDDKSLDPIDIDVNVLSSLLDSLDMEAGGAGPVSNMLREMGVDVPDLPQARRALVEVLDEVDESQ